VKVEDAKSQGHFWAITSPQTIRFTSGD